MRLNIAAGTAVRFEPGEEKEVELTDFAGSRIVHGFSGLVAGALDAPGLATAPSSDCGKIGLVGPERRMKR